jgi:hypothetical protein
MAGSQAVWLCCCRADDGMQTAGKGCRRPALLSRIAPLLRCLSAPVQTLDVSRLLTSAEWRSRDTSTLLTPRTSLQQHNQAIGGVSAAFAAAGVMQSPCMLLQRAATHCIGFKHQPNSTSSTLGSARRTLAHGACCLLLLTSTRFPLLTSMRSMSCPALPAANQGGHKAQVSTLQAGHGRLQLVPRARPRRATPLTRAQEAPARDPET